MTAPLVIKQTVETIEWTPEGVVMIDQTRLPRETEYVTCRSYREVADAIRNMIIRGAPAIGVAAAMGVALGALHEDDLETAMPVVCETLAKTRPTAVNLFWAIERMKRLYESLRTESLDVIRERMVSEAQQIRREDIAINEAIGRNGADLPVPGTLQLRPGRREPVGGPAGDRHVHALGEQGPGQGKAHAGAATDDDRVSHGPRLHRRTVPEKAAWFLGVPRPPRSGLRVADSKP